LSFQLNNPNKTLDYSSVFCYGKKIKYYSCNVLFGHLWYNNNSVKRHYVNQFFKQGDINMSENNKIEKKSHKKSLTIIAIIVAFIIGGASVAAYNNYTYQKKVEAAKKAIDEKKKELDTSVKKIKEVSKKKAEEKTKAEKEVKEVEKTLTDKKTKVANLETEKKKLEEELKELNK
jgi:hypothetical protein